jgi:hypothetical protein
METIHAILIMLRAITHNPYAVEPREEPAPVVVVQPAAQRNVAMVLEEPAPVVAPTKVVRVKRAQKAQKDSKALKLFRGVGKASHIRTVLSPNPENEDFSKIKMATLDEMASRY